MLGRWLCSTPFFPVLTQKTYPTPEEVERRRIISSLYLQKYWVCSYTHPPEIQFPVLSTRKMRQAPNRRCSKIRFTGETVRRNLGQEFVFIQYVSVMSVYIHILNNKKIEKNLNRPQEATWQFQHDLPFAKLLCLKQHIMLHNLTGGKCLCFPFEVNYTKLKLFHDHRN